MIIYTEEKQHEVIENIIKLAFLNYRLTLESNGTQKAKQKTNTYIFNEIKRNKFISENDIDYILKQVQKRVEELQKRKYNY